MGNKSGSDRSNENEDGRNNGLNIDIFDPEWIREFEKAFIFVWCDQSIGTKSNLDDYLNTIKQLAPVVNQNRQLVHTFNEINACRDFIIDLNNVCLIVSGAMGQELVPLVHNLEQIHSIYIFCMDRPKHLRWSLNYAKVRGVHTSIREICESLQFHIISRSSAEYDRIEFDLITTDSGSVTEDDENIFLIYSTLNRTILLNMDSSDHGKQDMISFCRNEYNAEHRIELINSFENKYSQNSPIWWYTKSFFFQGIINRALRINDLYALYSMHRFIKDLDSKLLEINDSQPITNEPLNLYFGQFLSKYDFEKIKQNVGNLLSINQFISANLELSMAVLYIEQQKATVTNGNATRAVFQIHIDQSKKASVSYANIGSKSQFVHEKEYLISMFSVYRIDKIEKLINASSAWLIHMTLLDQNDQKYNSLTQKINTIYTEDTNFTEVGYTIMSRVHLFKSANQLFKQALSHNLPAVRAIILYYNLAIIYDGLGEYGKAIKHYGDVRQIAKNNIEYFDQKDDICLVALYSNRALVFEQQGQFSNAFTHAFRALEIASRIPDSEPIKKELESSCLYNLGQIHDQEERINEARDFYKRSLQIRQGYLPPDHPNITIIQRLISLLPECQVEVF